MYTIKEKIDLDRNINKLQTMELANKSNLG